MRGFHDPILGICRRDQNELYWEAIFDRSGQKIQFTLGGATAPHPALLSHAGDIVNDLEAFNLRLRQYAEKYPGAREEVKTLKLEEVSLLSPDNPNDGML